MNDNINNDVYMGKRKYFDGGHTLPYAFRVDMLKALKSSIKRHEKEITKALKADLAKPEFEAYTAEIGFVCQQIGLSIKKLASWMKPKRVRIPLFLQFGSSRIYSQPKGVVLIVSPWNYPFQLAIAPLIGAIAAGNCAIVKPSEKSSHTSDIVERIISEAFPADYVSVIKGEGKAVVPPLIKAHRFDHIFFTGSPAVGKDIMKLAALHLSPVSLELGGKSPVIVHKDSDIDIAAKRIVWAKFYNVGQTCIAPDYLLVHASRKDALIERLKHYIREFYGDEPQKSVDYGRIIDDEKLERLIGLLEDSNIIEGGGYDIEDKYLAPTLVDFSPLDVNFNWADEEPKKADVFAHPLMREEIFGPILPILTYESIEDIKAIVARNPYPLALYIFAKDKGFKADIIGSISFGGGCVNNLISHIANPHLPFGGIGFSGMGSYHLKHSFDTFSHEKGMLNTKTSFDTRLLYPPYTRMKLRLIKRIFRS